jgi:hypothetical protein
MRGPRPVRGFVAGALVAAAAGVAHADPEVAPADGAELAVDVDAPPADSADDHASVQAAFGAGSDDGAMTMADLRAEWRGSGVAIGLGGRLRWRDGDLVRADWDDAGDWLGVIRRLELAHHGARVHGAIGVGRLAPITQGGVADDYTTSALVDRRAPGAIAHLRSERLGFDAAVDDVTVPTMIATGVEARLSTGWSAGVDAAVDPAADRRTGVAAVGAVELAARYTAGPFVFGAGAIVSSERDVAAVARTETAVARGRWHVGAMLEARAYGGATAAAPFGPLWSIEREAMIVGDGAGVAAAVSGRLAIDELGVLDVGVRTRGARGDLATARLALPWWRQVQAGAYTAVGEGAAIAAGEARVMWTPRWFSSIEAGRGYRRAADDALEPVWQLSAWFGAAAGW